MKKMIKIAFLAISGLIHADITHISIWERLLEDGQKQKLVFCGDQHNIKKQGYNQAQQIAKLAAVDTDNYIIMEELNDFEHLLKDVAHYNEQFPRSECSKRLQGELQHHHEKLEAARVQKVLAKENNVLFLLSHFAKEKGVVCQNVDFRKTFSVDLPILNIDIDPVEQNIASWMLQKKVAEISAFDDNASLKQFYMQVTAQFSPFMKYICNIMENEKINFQALSDYLFDLLLNDPDAYDPKLFSPALKEDNVAIRDNLTDIIHEIKMGNRSVDIKDELKDMMDCLLDLCTTDLIDACMLHAVFQKQISVNNKNLVFVCAGQAHIEQIEKVMPVLGYTLIENVESESGINIEAVCQSQVNQQAQNNWLKNIVSMFASIMAWFGL